MRSLVALVALTAFLLAGAGWVAELKHSRDQYLGRARSHAVRRAAALKFMSSEEDEKWKRWCMRFAEWHGEMERKYREAASRPWRRVEGDAEEPLFPFPQ